MKKSQNLILTSYLIFSLGVWQVLPAYALDIQSPTASAVNSATASKAKSGDQASEYQKGSLDSDDQESEGHKLALNTIAMLVVTLVATGILTACGTAVFDTPSMTIFMLTSLYYLVTEIFSYRHYAEAAKKIPNVDALDKSQQISTLEKAKKEAKAARDYLKGRASNTKVAAIGFAAAAVIAGIEGFKQLTTPDPSLTCAAAAKTDGSNAKDLFFKQTQLQYAHNLSSQLNHKTQTQIVNAKNDVDAYFLYREYENFQSGALVSPSLDEYHLTQKQASDTMAMDFTFSYLENGEQKVDRYSFKNLLLFSLQTMQSINPFSLPQAMADNALSGKYGPLIGAAGGALVGLLAAEVVIAPIMKSVLSYPLGRLIGFGVFSALGFALSKGNERAANVFAKNIETIDKKLQGYSEIEDGQEFEYSTGSLVASNLQSGAAPQKNNQKVLAGNYQNQNCLTTNNAKLAIDEFCQCLKTNSCQKASNIQLPANSQFAQGFPNASALVNKTLSQLSKAQGQLNQGGLQSATLTASEIHQNQKAFKDLLGQIEKNTNIQQLKNQKSPVNFDLQSEKFKLKMQKAAQVGLDKVGGIEGFKGTPINGLGLAEMGTPLAGPTFDYPVKNLQQSSTATKSADPINLFGEEVTKDQVNNGETALTKEEQARIDQFLLTNGDINNDQGENLFEIISGRYRRSGVLFLSRPAINLETGRQPANQ